MLRVQQISRCGLKFVRSSFKLAIFLRSMCVLSNNIAHKAFSSKQGISPPEATWRAHLFHDLRPEQVPNAVHPVLSQCPLSGQIVDRDTRTLLVQYTVVSSRQRCSFGVNVNDRGANSPRCLLKGCRVHSDSIASSLLGDTDPKSTHVQGNCFLFTLTTR
jgi:hypothetical protein